MEDSLQAAFPDLPQPEDASKFQKILNLARATRTDDDGDAIGRCLVNRINITSEETSKQMRSALSAAADGQQVAPEDVFRLIETDRETAKSILTRAMTINPVYPDFEFRCSSDQAMALVNEFLGAFDQGKLKLFTNITTLSGNRSWTSGLGHTFEAGVIAVDDSSIGVFWLCDDD